MDVQDRLAQVGEAFSMLIKAMTDESNGHTLD